MNLHLYKVLNMESCDMDNGNDVMGSVWVMTEKDLRKEFRWLINNHRLPEQLIADYKQDPDYSKEDWSGDFDKIKIGTIIDMMNDICNYTCGEGYYIIETDIEVELDRKMLDEWLDVLNYFDSDVQDAAERENKMSWYHKYEKVQDEIYRMIKGV